MDETHSALYPEPHQHPQQREQPADQPDTGWETSDPGGMQHIAFSKTEYEPQSNGTFASLLNFAQMYYNPAYSEHSDERLVNQSSCSELTLYSLIVVG